MATENKKSIIHQLIRILLPICLIASGVAGWQYYKSREPKMKRKPPMKQAMAVKTLYLKSGDYPSIIQAMGTVVPDRQVFLKARVSGEIVFLSPAFVRGGVVNKGDILVVLDGSDYKIEVKKAQSALDKALADLAIEQGNQKIAKEEFKLINEVSKGMVTATDLALRKPQLSQAMAAVQSARADIEKAGLNLSRTKISVPFNSLVLEKKVEMGSLVSVQESLATLVSVDTYHIETRVPLDRLEAVFMGKDTGSVAIVRSQYSDQTWNGSVYRTTGKISQDSRMAGVLVVVPDPLGLKTPAQLPWLMLDDHVSVQILGRTLKNVYKLPRKLLREGNTVWINHSGHLEIKKVILAWKQDQIVYVSHGISPDDAIVVSDLPAPVRGMALQNNLGKQP